MKAPPIRCLHGFSKERSAYSISNVAQHLHDNPRISSFRNESKQHLDQGFLLGYQGIRALDTKDAFFPFSRSVFSGLTIAANVFVLDALNAYIWPSRICPSCLTCGRKEYSLKMAFRTFTREGRVRKPQNRNRSTNRLDQSTYVTPTK